MRKNTLSFCWPSIATILFILIFLLVIPSQAKSLFLDGVTEVTLTFTPVGGGDAVVATAQDPDGTGPSPLAVVGDITLLESTEYDLSITVKAGDTDLTTEIQTNANDYLAFFGFTDGVFRSPAGEGNIDDRANPINYNDLDGNNLPVGLTTSWETNCGEEPITGTFRVLLKNQAGMKSATSTSEMGVTDFDLTWNVTVALDPNAPPL